MVERARRVKGDDSAEKNYVMQRSATRGSDGIPLEHRNTPLMRALQFCRGPVIFETHPTHPNETSEGVKATTCARITGSRRRSRNVLCPMESKRILRLSFFSPRFSRQGDHRVLYCLGHFTWRSSHRSQLSQFHVNRSRD